MGVIMGGRSQEEGTMGYFMKHDKVTWSLVCLKCGLEIGQKWGIVRLIYTLWHKAL